ncbi:P2Y purinoceptor 3-like [Megalops cyprinoides]|uniref:P2Y purinoceptor 3-like n=1 Tax=Megalops cyprinoides TaxID=118141 RepID=UPI0018655E21|nr:P2Y purinoceptor 3-like [Megalops cyprinoides]
MLVMQLYILPAFFLVVLLLGLPLNVLSLWVFSHRLKRWTRSSFFLFNLALADASWLLALPFLVQYHLDGVRWSLGQPFCKAVRLLYHNYFYLSIFFVTCISVDRYLAIVHPLRALSLMGRRQVCLLCAAIWVVTVVFSYPVVEMSLTQHCPLGNRTICTLYVFLEDTGESLPFSLCCSCTGFLLPFTAICYCCVCSVRELRARQTFPYRHCRKRRLTQVLSAVLVLFTLLYLPYHLTRNAAIVIRAIYPGNPVAWKPADLAFALEMCLCSLNTCVNPFFSCFVGRRFRQEFWGTFACRSHRHSDRRLVEPLGGRRLQIEVHTKAAILPLSVTEFFMAKTMPTKEENWRCTYTERPVREPTL